MKVCMLPQVQVMLGCTPAHHLQSVVGSTLYRFSCEAQWLKFDIISSLLGHRSGDYSPQECYKMKPISWISIKCIPTTHSSRFKTTNLSSKYTKVQFPFTHPWHSTLISIYSYTPLHTSIDYHLFYNHGLAYIISFLHCDWLQTRVLTGNYLLHAETQ